MNLGHWQTSLNIGTLPFGFVYEITCLITDKKYIGKKQCVNKRSLRPLKGKNRKRHIEVESDWQSYTSSSRELNEDIVKYGKDKFKFEIIKLCNSKSDLAYQEAKLQFEREVLFGNYYNGIINLRIRRFSPQKSIQVD